MRIENSGLLYGVLERQAGKQQEIQQQTKDAFANLNLPQTAQTAVEDVFEERKSLLQTMGQQLETSKKQMQDEKEKLKMMMLCLEISRRIMGGDKVPPADHKYLIENDPGLYARAISMRLPKSNPHEYKQLSEKEKLAPELTGGAENAAQGVKELMSNADAFREMAGALVDVKV